MPLGTVISVTMVSLLTNVLKVSPHIKLLSPAILHQFAKSSTYIVDKEVHPSKAFVPILDKVAGIDTEEILVL